MKSRERVLNAIIEYMEKHQFSPSIRELCDMTGLKSTSTVHQQLNNLEKEGKIRCFGVRQIEVIGYGFRKI